MALFPGAPMDHFITHFGFSNEPVTWNTVVFFGGRYELTYQVDVEVNYKENRVSRFVSEPHFYLWEVASISYLPDGRVTASYTPGNHKFGEKEWNEFVAGKGDFSKIGFQINTNAPLPDFDAYVRAVRAPRVPIDP